MQLEFNVTLDHADCHIRANQCRPVPEQVPNTRPHKHYSMEFHCVFAGQEIITLPQENKEIALSSGHILLLPQGIYHGVYTKNTTVERVCFNFSAEPSDKELSPIVQLFLGVREPVLFSDEKAAALVEQIYNQCTKTQGSLYSLRLSMHLLHVALELMSSVADISVASEPTDSLALRQRWIIEDYITQHYTDNTGIEGLAKELYLSQRQTSTLVKRYFGDDYKTIIIRLRMELAEIYLQDPDKRLDQIAYETGYRSYSGFELCFKRYFGMTPQKMRLQMQNERKF